MGEAALKLKYSVAEYFELEEKALGKSEYSDGEIIAMAGSTPRHSLLTSNIVGELREALKGKPCLTYSSDLFIAFDEEKYSYADASVICGAMEHYEESPLAAKNPVLIVEVLSDSTEKYDRGDKFRKYRGIKSFKEYVLISQNLVFVETFFLPDGIDFWQYKSYSNLDESIKLQSIDCSISLSDIYLGWIATPESTN